MLADFLLGTEAWFSTKCLLTWKPRVTKSGRMLFQLAQSVPRTDGTESGLLPTTRANEAKGSKYQYDKGNHSKPRPTLTGKIALLPTLQARDSKGAQGRVKTLGYMDLPAVISLLPTPKANDAKSPGLHGEGGLDLPNSLGLRTGLRLQPAFALWMMGYPEDWCDLEDGEMPRSKAQATRSSRRSR